jgi:hypothetical protein
MDQLAFNISDSEDRRIWARSIFYDTISLQHDHNDSTCKQKLQKPLPQQALLQLVELTW